MDQSQKITTYSAETGTSSFFKTLWQILSSLPDAHELAQRLFKRNIKALYRRSFLGFFWMLIPPVITAGLWIFLKNNSVANFRDTDIPYPVFVLTGTIIWQIFTEAFNAPLNSVSSNKNILIKINIPREALLLSGVYVLIFNLLVKLGLLAIVFWYFDQSISLSILMVPVGIGAIVICGFSLGIILIPIGMLYEDIQKMIPVILPFFMYLSPVIYPPRSEGMVGLIMKINPMASLLTETRNWFTSQPVYDFNAFAINTAIFSALLVVGLVIYKISMPMIIERIGS